MTLRAYRCQFEFAGKNGPGEPVMNSLIEVPLDSLVNSEISDDIIGEFVFSQHDRGESDNKDVHSFYQQVFRVDRSDEYVWIEAQEDDLVEKTLTYAGEEWHLRYQAPYFDKNGEIDSEKSPNPSISRSGCYYVCTQSERYRVIVLPSLLDKDEYLQMVDELLSLHEKMVVNDSSYLGLGARDENLAPGMPEWDVKWWKQIKPHILEVMKMPAILQKKEYGKTPTHRLKAFDSRVIRSYIMNQSALKTTAIAYSDDFNSYENRLVKAVLERLGKRIRSGNSYSQISEDEIKKAINGEYQDEFNSEDVEDIREYIEGQIELGSSATNEDTKYDEKIIETGKYQKNSRQVFGNGNPRTARIYIEEEEDDCFVVATQDPSCPHDNEDDNKEKDQKADKKCIPYFPFTYENFPCGLRITTTSPHVVISIVRKLSCVYGIRDKNEDDRVSMKLKYGGFSDKEFHLKYPIKDRQLIRDRQDRTSCETAKILYFTDVSEPSGTARSTSSLDDDCNRGDFYKELADALTELPEEVIKHVSLKNYDKVCYLERRKRFYESFQHRMEQSADAERDISTVLNSPWFASIGDDQNIALMPTPRFLHDRRYREIYRLLQLVSHAHPLLLSSYNENSFGVHQTHRIYEYWVFYQIISHLLNLGFHLPLGEKADFESRFRHFIDENEKPEGMTVLLTRDIPSASSSEESKTIEVMVGFNCVFGKKGVSGGFRVPDYFLRIKNPDYPGKYRWYFLDAKYDIYSKEKKDSEENTGQIPDYKGSKDPLSQIYEHYSKEIKEKKYLEEFINEHNLHQDEWDSTISENEVVGTYIIAASISEKMTISDSNRLYGGEVEWDKKTLRLKTLRLNHSRGIIEFKPSSGINQGKDELTTLLQLIFDYHEGSCSLGRGRERRDKFEEIHQDCNLSSLPLTLRACWNSSIDHSSFNPPSIQLEKTKSGKYKKIVMTCECGMSKVINYCINVECRSEIIKYDTGNFHNRDYRCPDCGFDIGEYNKRVNGNWDYCCPDCGFDIETYKRWKKDNP